MEEPRVQGGQSASGLASNVILIGRKPLMSYATAVLFQLNESRELSVKARGRAISKAVDVVEVVRKRFFGEKLNVVEIQIGTELVGEAEGRPRNVSTIEIKLEKKE